MDYMAAHSDNLLLWVQDANIQGDFSFYNADRLQIKHRFRT